MGAMDEPESKTEEMSGYLIKRAQAALHVRLEEIVSAHGLAIPQYVVLSFLAETPGLANADLARRAFVTPQSMNEVLKQLESDRPGPTSAEPHECPHPQRGPDPHRHQEQGAVDSQVREFEARLLAGLTSDERQTLNRALLTIIDNVTPS